MTENQQESTTRRDALRYGGLAGLAVVAGGVLIGLRRSAPSCDRDAVCGGCPVLARCRMPAAVKKRDETDGRE